MNKGLRGYKKLVTCNAPSDTLLQELQKMGIKKPFFRPFFDFPSTIIKCHDSRSIPAMQNLPNSLQMRIHRVYAKRLVMVVYGIVAMYWRLATMFSFWWWNAICATMEHSQPAYRWIQNDIL